MKLRDIFDYQQPKPDNDPKVEPGDVYRVVSGDKYVWYVALPTHFYGSCILARLDPESGRLYALDNNSGYICIKRQSDIIIDATFMGYISELVLDMDKTQIMPKGHP